MYLAIQLIHLLFAKDSLVTVLMEMWLSPHKNVLIISVNRAYGAMNPNLFFASNHHQYV